MGEPETVRDIIAYLDSTALGGPAPMWPPDVFAIAAMLLRRSGSYREVANVWPPKEFDNTNDWHDAIMAIADQWREQCDLGTTTPPPTVMEWWSMVLGHEAMLVENIHEDRYLFVALVGLLAAADFACRGFGFTMVGKPSVKERRANLALETNGTLCESIHSSRCVVLPKAHNPYTGMTLRSLTHNLALWDRPEVSASWEYLRLAAVPTGSLNVLILPWPLEVAPTAFHEARDYHELKLPKRVGLFEYDISFGDAEVAEAIRAVDQARAAIGDDIHAIIFPELAMNQEMFTKVRERVQKTRDIPLLLAGIGGPNNDRLGSNYVAISANAELSPYEQSKHHRWRIDESQARNYDLLGQLPAKPDNGAWWESIEIGNRFCYFFNLNNWLTFCALICEDLARPDPVSELVRSVGPGLVVALLLDAGQVRGRWPDRYATVLAEDPRSSVLTVTSAGLVDLALSVRGSGTRSIALWKEAFLGTSREIELDSDSVGVVLRLKGKQEREWTADGRHDDGETTYLSLVEPPVQIR